MWHQVSNAQIPTINKVKLKCTYFYLFSSREDKWCVFIHLRARSSQELYLLLPADGSTVFVFHIQWETIVNAATFRSDSEVSPSTAERDTHSNMTLLERGRVGVVYRQKKEHFTHHNRLGFPDAKSVVDTASD